VFLVFCYFKDGFEAGARGIEGLYVFEKDGDWVGDLACRFLTEA
jgi:hypothetical protein